MPDSTSYSRFDNYLRLQQTPQRKEDVPLHFYKFMKSLENRRAYVNYIFNKIKPHYIVYEYDTLNLIINKSNYQQIAYRVIDSCVLEYEELKFALIHPKTGELYAESNGNFTTAIQFSNYIYDEFIATNFYSYVGNKINGYGVKLENDAKILQRQNHRLARLKKEPPLKKYQVTKGVSRAAKSSGFLLRSFFKFWGSAPVEVFTNVFPTQGSPPPDEKQFSLAMYNLIAQLCEGKLSKSLK